MRTILTLLLALLGLLPSASARPSGEDLKVVCTLPDLADITRRIGGERVDVTSIARGRENVHGVRIKPSHIIAVSRADLFVQIGLSLEHAWVPGLLEVARNRDVRPGGKGFVNVSTGWKVIGVPEDLTRKHAVDIHPEGNPHLNLSPGGGRHMAQAVHSALVKADPEGRAAFDAGLAAYEEELDRAEARWAEIGKGLKGKGLVLYHRDLDYFMHTHGMDLVGTLEPKPGLPPTPSHVLELSRHMREVGCRAVAIPPWASAKQARRMVKEADAQVVEVPQMVDGVKGADTWIEMMDLLHERIRTAVQAP